ncbi:MAG: hypothetical protein ACXV2E_08735 [Halobacteriota archaeon]
MQPKIEEAPQARTGRGFKGDDSSRPHLSNPTEAQRQERNLDEILTCWRWARSLDHRLNIYQLQFEHDVAGALASDHQALASEINSFRTVVHELAR